MKLAQRTHRKPWAASLALVLVCALLWAHLLGLTHRVVHGPQLAGSAVASQFGGATGGVTGGEAGFLAPLFAGHQGADCSTFDQLSHADALAGVPLLEMPIFAVLRPATALSVQFLIIQRLRLQARGPPLTC